ncbi:uncharacterized protein LOC131238850 [Magnolia sinica]|uniref:uncharacterized protein LOC131238850 n=1 Tax=Magnolia sinica TaxID=86752 RepID=UPI002657DAE9|nr:uncharacterized protein LOC131238850 [Magnolia sinica]
MVGHWPFAQWGIDIIDPLPTGKGQTKFAIVAVDYFTKWVEAEPLAKITKQKVTDFVWKNIICRFGIPHTIVSDNGKQFDNKQHQEMCKNLGIHNVYSSPRHHQENGQVEARTTKSPKRKKVLHVSEETLDVPEVLEARPLSVLKVLETEKLYKINFKTQPPLQKLSTKPPQELPWVPLHR